MSAYRYIISGGGTGGHIFPAIAIANALKEANPQAEILFVGAEGKMEMEKVPEAGYEIIGLPIRGIQRKLDIRNLKVPFLLLSSLMKSFKTLRKFKPDAVIGVGGYASAAIVFAASFKGIKTVIQEQNSYPGITNKILSKRVDLICTAFDGMEKFFPSEKIKLLGNPIRQDILANADKKSDGLRHFNLVEGITTLLAVGGSLGARTINNCAKALRPLIQTGQLQLLWQCGKYQYADLKKELEDSPIDGIHLHQFIKEMDLAYAASDFMISRAGAISISEITCLGKASILIPSPNVAEDHQTKNAKALSDHGAAILLEDSKAADNILEHVESMLKDETKLDDIRKNLEKVFSNDKAAADIAKEINLLLAG